MSKQETQDSTESPAKPVLAQLLKRRDVWRGHSQSFVDQGSWSTGHAPLDQALLHKGWPLGSLVEICQAQHTQAEWLLLGPVIRQACSQGGYTFLLNPPSRPYVPGLVQQSINLDRIILIQAERKSDFVASLVDILRTPVCQLLLCWEPPQGLSYAELRKCQLAAAGHPGFCALFRHQRQQQQSSPATLRLSTRLNAHALELRLFKQRGKLRYTTVQLPLPANWNLLPAHRQLGQPQPAQVRPHARVPHFSNSIPESKP